MPSTGAIFTLDLMRSVYVIKMHLRNVALVGGGSPGTNGGVMKYVGEWVSVAGVSD